MFPIPGLRVRPKDAHGEPRAGATHTAPACGSGGAARALGTWPCVLLIALIGLFFYEWLDDLFEAGTLVRPDEGRYAEIAREMAVSGDWITPRLNGLKYFEKPPLQYWGTAAAFQLFGVEAWAARLWTMVSAVLSMIAVAFTAARLRSMRDALAITAVLGSSLLFVVFGMAITLDMALTLCLTIAACAAALAMERPAGSSASRWMLLAWASLAAAVLTKGLIGIVLPALAAGTYLLTTRHWQLLRRVHPVSGTLLLLAISAPWFVLVQQRNPEFFDFFFVHEHFQRFTTTEHHRTGAWWYFLAVGAVGFMPWTPMFASWAVSSLRRFRSRRRALSGRGEAGDFSMSGALVRGIFPRTRPDAFDADRWFACWAIVTIGFFSVSSSKLPGYIVPALPAMAWVVGLRLRRASNRNLVATLGVNVAIALGMVAALPLIERALDARYEPALVDVFVARLSACLLWLAAGAAVAAASVLMRYRQAAIIALALAALFSWDGLMDGVRLFTPTLSSRQIVARAVESEGDALRSAPFYTVEVFDQTLPFYLGRAVTMVSVTDELAMGLRGEPQRGIASIDEWARRWAGLERGYAYMREPTYRRLAETGLDARLVATDRRFVIIARR